MEIDDYTLNQLSLICKHINDEFIAFKTGDGQMHFAFGIHRYSSGRIYNVNQFISGIDYEQVKKYLLYCIHNTILSSPYPIDVRLDKMTEDHNCCEPYKDFYMVTKYLKPVHIIADNKGFYGLGE